MTEMVGLLVGVRGTGADPDRCCCRATTSQRTLPQIGESPPQKTSLFSIPPPAAPAAPSWPCRPDGRPSEPSRGGLAAQAGGEGLGGGRRRLRRAGVDLLAHSAFELSDGTVPWLAVPGRAVPRDMGAHEPGRPGRSAVRPGREPRPSQALRTSPALSGELRLRVQRVRAGSTTLACSFFVFHSILALSSFGSPSSQQWARPGPLSFRYQASAPACYERGDGREGRGGEEHGEERRLRLPRVLGGEKVISVSRAENDGSGRRIG